MVIERKPWFRRLGDIPGITYTPNPSIVRSKLRGHDSKPEVHVFDFEGKRRESLLWPSREGRTSASPVHERAFPDREHVGTEEILRNLYEGLELPGEPADYHFLIQHCVNELWSRRRSEPAVLPIVEKLCLLNIQLIEACPYAVSSESDGERSFYGMAAFSCLIDLYEKNGLLREALAVAEKSALFGQGERDRDELRERIASIEAEADE